jgi:hypothetical protein
MRLTEALRSGGAKRAGNEWTATQERDSQALKKVLTGHMQVISSEADQVFRRSFSLWLSAAPEAWRYVAAAQE